MAQHGSHASSPVILLLAAGEGSRYGGIKQLADIEDEPMVRRVARTVLETTVPVIVVTGAHAEEVERVIDDLPLHIARCDDWQLGMGQSLATGVRFLVNRFPDASAVLICLADQPLLSVASLQPLLQRHAQAPKRLLATERNGISGPPALFPRDCFPQLMAQSGPYGARAVLENEAMRVEAFASGETMDIDTLEDLKRVRQWLADAHLRTKMP
ncbi:nucleotidyltransferase family protein [Dyella dinghuensis]|uniref:Nucleotidyltransferase family protein n=1 Tax=Dyella dinghuensis TaxID=1920169 RepID=A0A3S0PG81_9GAMM|nr:nucleotidyltransferase family protein [Dyella dinghuensis]RUL65909.1 nucleotidyltransferase family protein [Dyella dinghuensis]